MKKYIVIPANTDLNRGDQALVWESIRVAKEAGLIGEYYLMDSGETEEERILQSSQSLQEGYQFIRRILPHPGRGEKEGQNQFYSKKQLVKWGLRAFKDGISRAMLLSKFKIVNRLGYSFLNAEEKKSLEIIKDADAVIVKGGGFIHSYGGITAPYYIFYSLYNILLAKKYKKKIFIMPNSFGPFKGIFVPFLVKKALNNVEFISARERISSEQLGKVLNKRISVYPDLGFFLEESKGEKIDSLIYRKNIPFGQKQIVAITVRPYRFPKSENPNLLYKKYIKSIADTIIWLNNKGFFVLLVSQTLGPSSHEDDRKAIKDVLNNLNNTENVEVIEEMDLNCRDLKFLYGQVDYLIGTRFHSVIFSISSNTPAIAISYGGNKGEGIMKEIGLQDFEIPIEKVSFSVLTQKFEELRNNKKYYLDKVAKYMEKAKKEREYLIETIRQLYKYGDSDK